MEKGRRGRPFFMSGASTVLFGWKNENRAPHAVTMTGSDASKR
jgi:hypothetical protein